MAPLECATGQRWSAGLPLETATLSEVAMTKLIDITGQTFGRLIVVEHAGSRSNRALWRCRCECGNELIAQGKLLRKGKVKSCGCLRIDWPKQNFVLHGDSRRGHKTRLYGIWGGMRNRCDNPQNSAFVNYGGRGIRVCDEWHRFESFRDWALAHGYSDNLSIERTNNDGNYEPDNCAWIPLRDQWQNQRGEVRKPRAVVRSDGKCFASVTDAARASGSTTSRISAAIKRRGTSSGYGWRYL